MIQKIYSKMFSTSCAKKKKNVLYFSFWKFFKILKIEISRIEHDSFKK